MTKRGVVIIACLLVWFIGMPAMSVWLADDVAFGLYRGVSIALFVFFLILVVVVPMASMINPDKAREDSEEIELP